MDDLPELPFEKVLSYLSLEDVIKSRAVSRRWYKMISGFKAKSLGYSQHPSGFILGKSRWVSGAFAQNFISSPRFEWFFNTFGQTILSNLKCLRLCDLLLNKENRTALVPTINSFGQLEELDIIHFDYPPADSNSKIEFELNLPMLNRIHLVSIHTESGGTKKLTLDAPRLKEVKLAACLRLDLVHAESVERLIVEQLEYIAVKKLKNLKYLHCYDCSRIDSTFLSSLKHLREIHLLELNHLVRLNHREKISEIFEQKQRYGRAELKIYLLGLLLSDPHDPAIDSRLDKRVMHYCAVNIWHLAKIPFNNGFLSHKAIESQDSEAQDSEVNIANRFTDLITLAVDKPVRDVQRFLDLLKNFDNIVELQFWYAQSQDLFDRLPEHSAVQVLVIYRALPDFRFLFRLKNLISIHLNCSIDAETVRKLFEELEFLSKFGFEYSKTRARIETGHSKSFMVSADGKTANVADLDAAIQFIVGYTPQTL